MTWQLVDDAELKVAMAELRGLASSVDDEEHWTRSVMQAIVRVVPTNLVLVAEMSWNFGLPKLRRLDGVKRLLASTPRHEVSPISTGVVAGFESAFVERLLALPPAGFLSPPMTAMLTGAPLLVSSSTASFRITSRGMPRFAFIMSMPEGTTRVQLTEVNQRLGALMALHAGVHRTLLADGRELAWPAGDIPPAVLDSVEDAVLRFDPRELRVVGANVQAEAVFHAAAQELLGLPLSELIPRPLLGVFVGERRHLGLVRREHVRLTRVDGQPFAAHVTLVWDGRAESLGHVVVANRAEVEQAVRQADTSLNEFRAFANLAPFGLLHVDETFQTLFVNALWCALHGVSEHDAQGHGWVSGLPPDQAESMVEELRQDMLLGRDFHREVRIGANGPSPTVLQVTARPLLGQRREFLGFISTAVDITAQREADERLRVLAERDPLTGLANRAALSRRLEERQGRRDRDVSGLLFVDLDEFKGVNDSHGHSVGDLVLQEIAARLTGSVRAEDLVARTGGDEFVIVLVGVPDEAAAKSIAETVREAVSQPIEANGHLVRLTPSIGVAMTGGQREGYEDLLKRADVAMYEAKAGGKDGVAFYSKSMDDTLARRSEQAKHARDAVGRDEFAVHYQLVGEVDGEGFVGVEALLRWDADPYRESSPEAFVPLLEANGLIGRVGQNLVQHAAAEFVGWLDEGLLPPSAVLAVNVSPFQLRRPDFATEFQASIESGGLAPQQVMLEVTESAVLDGAGISRAMLSALRRVGVAVALDDFGTGYASLANLRALPVDVIKIDRQFVANVEVSARDRAITQAVCSLAKALGLRTVAEGVEQRSVRQALVGMGCDAYQGFWLHRPESGVDLAQRLRGINARGDDNTMTRIERR